MSEFVDVHIGDLRLDDPTLEGWDGKTRQLVPPGEYVLEVIDAKQTVSKKGNPTLNVEYRIVSEGDAFGKTVKQWYSLDPGNEWSRKRLKHVLVDALQVPLTEGGGFSTGSMMGLQMSAEVVHETSKQWDEKNKKEVEYTNEKVCSERAMEAEPVKTAPPPPAAKGAGSQPAKGANGAQKRTPVGTAQPR